MLNTLPGHHLRYDINDNYVVAVSNQRTRIIHYAMVALPRNQQMHTDTIRTLPETFEASVIASATINSVIAVFSLTSEALIQPTKHYAIPPPLHTNTPVSQHLTQWNFAESH
ncbi:hypothetical protein ccbrp13_19660 [Ktedonobacteria bacterium brp13]|nr:hypothetical protein ccbrp13_19660 [Ktedonobacteria bacterium brp13]